MSFRLILAFFFLISLISLNTCAQENDQIRLSGIVMRLDSIKPIPYTNISIKNTRKGVISDQMGLFSIIIDKKDTVVFSSIGSKITYFVLPDTLTGNSYSIIQKLPFDTVSLKTLEINSWPSLKHFNDVFTSEQGYDDNFKIAQQNASPLLNNITYNNDVDMNRTVEFIGGNYTYVYENANIPLNNLLNPKRWDKLFKDWNNGKHR